VSFLLIFVYLFVHAWHPILDYTHLLLDNIGRHTATYSGSDDCEGEHLQHPRWGIWGECMLAEWQGMLLFLFS
jgi:hypothetical protein